MGLKTKLNYQGGYYEIPHKKPSHISLGFEWEVPLENPNWEYSDMDPDDLAEETGIDERLISHLECEGLELISPVVYNLSQARRLVREVKEEVLSAEGLTPYLEESQCGIHVHVAVKGVSRSALWTAIFGVVNRESSKEFIWDFSGRENSDGWSGNGRVNSWDSVGHPSSVARSGDPYDCNNIRFNSVGTTEFRLFFSDPDLLLPSVEFTHSLTKFLLPTLAKNSMISSHTDVKELDRILPTLIDYKDWLFKRSGYEALKDYAPWDKLKGKN